MWLIRRAVSAAVIGALVLAASGQVLAQRAPGVSMDDALRLIDAAQKEATTRHYLLSFAVVDARGDLIAVVPMAGAGGGSPDTAIGKAMLSAMYGQPSGVLTNRATSSIALGINEATGGRFRFFQGALPIVRGGFVVGAMAASGASAQQDEDTVKAAFAAVPLPQ